MSFKDNFSKQAEFYARFRPVYPRALFEFLSSLTMEHSLAWDCGTGNGQCAVELGNFYESVFASDPSEKQIQHAIPFRNVTYKTEKGELSSLGTGSVDLITVAQALHWMHIEEFFDEAKRVMKDNAVIAVISYVNPVVTKDIDNLTDQLHDDVLKDFWQNENKMVMDEYRSISFPFKSIAAPEFKIEKQLMFDDFIGHLRSWSAVQRYIDSLNKNPLPEFERALSRYWDKKESKQVDWKLNLKIGRKE